MLNKCSNIFVYYFHLKFNRDHCLKSMRRTDQVKAPENQIKAALQ